MMKPEGDDLLMPSSILTYSSEHFQFRCLQFQPDAAHTNYVEMLARALLCHQTCCDRQYKQQPLLHNSKWLFSRHKCVLSSAGGKWGWNADAVRICRYEHKEIWPICLLITHTRSSSALPAIRTVYASVARTLQTIHLEEMESYDREKGGLHDYNYTLCWKLNPSQVESISHGQSKSPILVWCHSCFKFPRNCLTQPRREFGQEAVEHLNPNQTFVLTTDQPLSAIA